MATRFAHVPQGPVDPILGLNVAFKADPSPNKINLGVGAYRTEDGKTLVLSAVKKAEQKILSENYNKEYLPIEGFAPFNVEAAKLLFGDFAKTNSKRIVSVQALSGTGSLKIGAEFIHKFLPDATVYIPDPTWPNHRNVFTTSYVPVKTYRYYKAGSTNPAEQLDFQGLCEDIKNAPPRSVFILHACAHNPTGVDPSEDQWKTIAKLIKAGNHFPFFDCAYQGFASGDLDRDAFAIRYFAEQGFEMFAAQSFAKNFGLYGERIGAFHAVVADPNVVEPTLSQLKLIIRAFYSSPPMHGALIVQIILSDPELCDEWKRELKEMSGRIYSMRQQLYEKLKSKGIDWPHVLTQIGMFSFTGLTVKQCSVLTSKHHIYLTSNGRISLPGLSSKTVPILADAIEDVLNNVKENAAKL